MTLREALQGLADRTYDEDHHRVLEPVLARLVKRREQSDDMVQDFLFWLLGQPEQLRNLLEASDINLRGYLAQCFARFAYEQQRETPKGLLRKALDTAIRGDQHFVEAGGRLSLGTSLVAKWPDNLWHDDGERFDHTALRQAALAALGECGCPLSRSELSALIFERYSVDHELCLRINGSYTSLEDKFRRKRDGEQLALAALAMLDSEERMLLAVAFARGHARGRPNQRIQAAYAKLKVWLDERSKKFSTPTLEEAIAALERHLTQILAGQRPVTPTLRDPTCP